MSVLTNKSPLNLTPLNECQCRAFPQRHGLTSSDLRNSICAWCLTAHWYTYSKPLANQKCIKSLLREIVRTNNIHVSVHKLIAALIFRILNLLLH